jgi:glycosyltransferase involved in cell wall biosynthesis
MSSRVEIPATAKDASIINMSARGSAPIQTMDRVKEFIDRDKRKMPIIGLIMIVKNESKIIERCIASVLGFVDFYIICDTGSTDDTRQKIRDFTKKHKLPGILYKHTWKNYGHNRTEGVNKALEYIEQQKWPRDNCWLYSMDADQILVNTIGFDKTWLTCLPPEKRTKGFHISLQTRNWRYRNTRLFYCRTDWQCVNRVHEVWVAKPMDKVEEQLDQFPNAPWVFDYDDGGNHTTKHQRELALLKLELEDKEFDPRTHYYLGHTYFGLGKHKKAIEHFKQAFNYTTWEEERWSSLYNMALGYQGLKKWTKALNYYLLAYQLRPYRLETIHRIIKYYREANQNDIAWFFLRDIPVGSLPLPEQDYLLIEKDVYDYAFDTERSILCYYMGKDKIGIAACDRLLHLPHSSLTDRQILQAHINLSFYVKPLTKFLQRWDSRLTETEQTADLEIIPLFENPKPKKQYATINSLEDIGMKMHMPIDVQSDSAPLRYVGMNPCIQNQGVPNNQLYINCRMVNYHIGDMGQYDLHSADKVVKTRNVLLTCNADATEVLSEILLETPPAPFPHVMSHGLEDIRMVYWQGAQWMTCVSWEHHPNIKGPQIVLGKIDVIAGKIIHIFPLVSPNGNTCEKNWLPFVDPDTPNSLLLLYDSGPTTILEITPDMIETATTAASLNQVPYVKPTIRCINKPYKNMNFMEFRGSCSPLLCSAEQNKYWLYLIHEVLNPQSGQKRQYAHRFVRMDAKFNITGISYPFSFGKLDIEYATGMALLPMHHSKANRPAEWPTDVLVISYGRNDQEAMLAKLSLTDALLTIHDLKDLNMTFIV